MFSRGVAACVIALPVPLPLWPISGACWLTGTCTCAALTRRSPSPRLLQRPAAGAAKMIAENNWRDAAAVASRRAGELYGLNVLDEDIQVGTGRCAWVDDMMRALPADPLQVQDSH